MNFYKKYINFFIYKILTGLIILYQKIISPVIPARCRYYPTCSDYGKHALAWHGVWSGSGLLLKRLGRCQPWGGHGIDFVPVPLSRYHYKLVPHTKYFNDSQSAEYWLPDYLSSSVYRDNTSYVARLNYLLRQR